MNTQITALIDLAKEYVQFARDMKFKNAAYTQLRRYDAKSSGDNAWVKTGRDIRVYFDGDYGVLEIGPVELANAPSLDQKVTIRWSDKITTEYLQDLLDSATDYLHNYLKTDVWESAAQEREDRRNKQIAELEAKLEKLKA